MVLKSGLFTFGITFNGMNVTLLILKVSIGPYLVGKIGDDLSTCSGALLTGT